MCSGDPSAPRGGPDPGGLPLRRAGLVAAVICAAVLVAYRDTGGAPFLLDDVPSILENPGLAGGPWTFAAWTPPPWSFTAGRPVLNWSFAASAGLGGLDSAGFRWANVALHALNAVLLFLIVTRVLRAAAFSRRMPADPALVGAACALLWAVHPLPTAAVTYISQRAEVLMATFHLATVLGFLRALDSRRPGLWRGLAATSFAAGVMTKETVVAAPLVCLLLDRAAGAASGRGLRRGGWRDYAVFLPGLILLTALAISTALTSRLAVAGGGWFGPGVAAIQMRALGEYLSLALWPHPLVFDRGTSEAALAAYPVWPGLVALLLGVAGAGLLWGRRLSGLPFVLFLVLLAPTTSLVPVLGQPIADHRVYLPLAVCCAGVATALFRFLPRGAVWIVAPLSVALVTTTVARNADYRTEESIWTDTVSKAP